MIRECWQFWRVLAVLAIASLACSSSPGWVASQVPERTAVPSEIPSQAPEVEKPKTGPTQAPRSPDPLRATVSAIRSVNVRADSSTESESISVLYHGAEVILSGRCRGIWAEIFFEGSRAWVNGRYLAGDKCEEEE